MVLQREFSGFYLESLNTFFLLYLVNKVVLNQVLCKSDELKFTFQSSFITFAVSEVEGSLEIVGFICNYFAAKSSISPTLWFLVFFLQISTSS